MKLKPLLRKINIRNKDHDTMMSYLEADTAPTHATYAWHYHSNRGAKYIKKLEATRRKNGEVEVELDIIKTAQVIYEDMLCEDLGLDKCHHIADLLNSHLSECLVRKEKI